MRSKSFFSSVVAAVSLAAALPAQTAGPLAVHEPQKLVVKRTGAATQTLKAEMKPGYHCNSDKPTEEWMIPLKLTWQSTAVQAKSVVYPRPKMQKFEFSEKPISVLDGAFDIVTTLERIPNAMPGPSVLSGKLRYQACNDKMCLPPKTIEVKVPLLVE